MDKNNHKTMNPMNMDIQYSLLAALVDEKKTNIFDDIAVR